MQRRLSFVKLANKWFVVLPEWEGDVEDLQMVCGADLLLECISNGQPVVTISIVEKSSTRLTLLSSDDYGATYKVNSPYYQGDVWLCNVTKYVLGEFPKVIYIIREDEEETKGGE